jgi:hypothetical protein
MRSSVFFSFLNDDFARPLCDPTGPDVKSVAPFLSSLLLREAVTSERAIDHDGRRSIDRVRLSVEPHGPETGKSLR